VLLIVGVTDDLTKIVNRRSAHFVTNCALQSGGDRQNIMIWSCPRMYVNMNIFVKNASDSLNDEC
jgi:hypothetical protein